MTTAPVPRRPLHPTETGPLPGRAGASGFFLLLPLLALLYVATGRLGLLLAVPPGYASAIFPPAGIAATAMLTAGRATLPWTFLGSLILNLWIGYDAGILPLPMAVLAALLIAAASTAQAALTGWALRRALGYPTALDDDGQVSRFLLLPPLCCLTSASLSLSGLWALGVVAESDLAASWLAWWVGDTLGVLIVLPLMLVFVGEPRALWRARLRPVALPMLLFFGLFVAIFIRVSAWENSEQMLEFRLVSQQTLDKIRTRLDEQQVFLEHLKRSFEAQAPITRNDFTILAQGMLQRYPALQAIEWAPLVAGDQRAAFESAQQGAIPGFEIREIEPSGQTRRIDERASYYPVTFIEPLRGNEDALGLDLASGADREAAVAQALAGDVVVATAPVRPHREPTSPAILLLAPVRGGGNGPGLVSLVLHPGAFIDALLGDSVTTLRLRLIDTARQTTLYGNLSGDTRRLRYRQEFDFGQRRYAVESEPTDSYLARKRGWQSWLWLSAGVLGTGLLGALLLLGTGYAHRIQTQVEEQTRDLAAANRQLRVEIDERRNAETALREAQRMEAIGRLTGGIAHDFNNLLTVVSANAELLVGQKLGERGQRATAAILRAADRGERLTRQLLSFSRRQPLWPETVDLRQRTGEIADMLARTLRGNIEMTLDMPEGLWPVAIDPGEFDLAVLNIAVNARDAMPDGGEFRVAARNLSVGPTEPVGAGLAGDFVALTFSDTGCGMSGEVLAHAFEPYFTTKAVGAGSGLGLSQVYSFARQSGGGAVLASEPGAGASVTLFLPRASPGAAPSADNAPDSAA